MLPLTIFDALISFSRVCRSFHLHSGGDTRQRLTLASLGFGIIYSQTHFCVWIWCNPTSLLWLSLFLWSLLIDENAFSEHNFLIFRSGQCWGFSWRMWCGTPWPTPSTPRGRPSWPQTLSTPSRGRARLSMASDIEQSSEHTDDDLQTFFLLWYFKFLSRLNNWNIDIELFTENGAV